MINIGLPPPLLARLRLQWQNTRNQFLRQTETLRESYFRTTAVFGGWIRRFSAKGIALVSLRQRTVRRHLQQFDAFEQVYESMVDLVCWTAKEDINPERAARYTELRDALRKSYRIVRVRLRSHWHSPETTSDPFEALYLPESITEFTHSPLGIDCLMQTRCAMDTYRNELESRRK